MDRAVRAWPTGRPVAFGLYEDGGGQSQTVIRHHVFLPRTNYQCTATKDVHGSR
jgi:hypothetical protein